MDQDRVMGSAKAIKGKVKIKGNVQDAIGDLKDTPHEEWSSGRGDATIASAPQLSATGILQCNPLLSECAKCQSY